MVVHFETTRDWFTSITLKADMKRYIPLETAAIFFLANLFPKQGIISEYVMVNFICLGKLGLQGAKTEKFLPIAGLELTTPDSQV